jgi:hypothetical protein
MIHAEWVEMKKKEFSEQKLTPMKKISNNFIDNTINKNNLNAIKTIFYLATVLDNFDFDKEMDSLEIDLKSMFKYTNITAQEARNNLKAMQETSITFINEEKKWELHIVLIPRIEFFYGQNRIEIDLYSKIAKLIVEVKDNYTYVDTNVLMSLKSKHTIRILPLLEKLRGYSSHIAKRKIMSLEALNQFFGTKYKNIYEIERKILKPAKEELDSRPIISFIYRVQMESFGRGRPRATSVVIDVIVPAQYYLSTKRIFIEYMRKEFVNRDILKTIDKETHNPTLLSISKHGKLYDKNSENSFDAKRANELWDMLYRFAQEGELDVLLQ